MESKHPTPPRAPQHRPGPKGGTRDRNRVERTRNLCDAALALFLTHGVDVPSVDQITRAAGVGKASFYSYFADKQELVDTLLASLREQALGALARCNGQLETADSFGDLKLAHQQMVVALLPAFLDHVDVLRLVLQEARAPKRGARQPIRQLYDDIVSEVVAINVTACRRKLIRPIQPRVSAYITLGAVERLGVGYLAGEDLGDINEAIQSVLAVLLAGLRPVVSFDS